METMDTLQVHFSQETPTNNINNNNLPTPFRTRRFTPYQKTPKSRNVKGTAFSRSPQDRDEICKEIVNQTWTVYRCSPLYEFSYATNDIKTYSRLISKYFKAECQKGLAIIDDKDTVDKVQVSVVKGLKGLNNSGPDAVRIIAKDKITSGSKEGESRVVLTAILCCMLNERGPLKSVPSKFTFLPLLLVKGPIAFTRMLHSWLQVTFDCVVSPVSFTPVQLSWTLALWVGEVTEKKSAMVQLYYETPRGITGIKNITFEINHKDCQKAWNKIHEPEVQEVVDEEVILLQKALEVHFYHHFKIDLSAMSLTRVGNSIIYMSSEGKLKILSSNHVGQILLHLTELTLEQLPAPSSRSLSYHALTS